MTTATEEKPDTAPVVRYGVSDAAIADLRNEVGGLRADVDYDATRLALGRIVKLRTGVEKRRKELKEDALKWGRKVDSEAKRLTGLLEEIETPLRDSKDARLLRKPNVSARKPLPRPNAIASRPNVKPPSLRRMPAWQPSARR